jgi:hypothetical protein
MSTLAVAVGVAIKPHDVDLIVDPGVDLDGDVRR